MTVFRESSGERTGGEPERSPNTQGDGAPDMLQAAYKTRNGMDKAGSDNIPNVHDLAIRASTLKTAASLIIPVILALVAYGWFAAPVKSTDFLAAMAKQENVNAQILEKLERIGRGVQVANDNVSRLNTNGVKLEGQLAILNESVRPGRQIPQTLAGDWTPVRQ